MGCHSVGGFLLRCAWRIIVSGIRDSVAFSMSLAGTVSVLLHHGGPQGAKSEAEVVADILAGIKERRA